MQRLSIAPMIDWTYSHFRVFMRLLAPRALLYTEMQTPGAIFNNPERALSFQAVEMPLALQLGGSNPLDLQACATIATRLKFAEINLNCGCPSSKVLAGKFGACLMQDPALVVDCIAAMKDVTDLPISVKTRIGIDEHDSYDFFKDFVGHIAAAGCDKLIVHARKAWLSGLNPKQNRTIPPINYDYVYAIKKEFPDLPIVVNGNIKVSSTILDHLKQVDGVMLGRLACDNPFALTAIHQALYPEDPVLSQRQVLAAYCEYAKEAYANGAKLSLLIKPLLNFAHGMPGAKGWKQLLMGRDVGIFSEALEWL